MSNIGKNPIQIPSGVKIIKEGSRTEVSGPKGTLIKELPSNITVTLEGEEALVKRSSELKVDKQAHGLVRSILANMVQGVTEGYEKRLKFVGVGYRAQVQGKKLELNVGYSHPIEVEAPEGIDFKVDKNIIIVSGIDKELIGKVAAKIRDIRKPEPYKGKGIMYEDEAIRRKAGKSFKAGEGS